MRVEVVVQATQTFSTELSTATSTSTHARLQRRRAIAKSGDSAERTSASTSPVPQPRSAANDVKRKKAPPSAIEAMIARGRIRRGSALSSASGATDSKPAKQKSEKTTPSPSPLALGAPAGTKLAHAGASAGPGVASAHTESARMMPISRSASVIVTRAESVMPRYTSVVTTRSPTRKNAHHGQRIPHSVSAVCWSR